MIRSLTQRVAVAGLLALAGTAQAQNLQLYGLVDLTAGRFQTSGTSRVWRVDSGAMTTSYLGLRGSDDLGGGIRAKFAIEHYLRLDTGQTGRFDGEPFWARDAYVGLSGAFGTTVLGRNTTPLFISTAMFNAFADSFAFSPSIRQLFTPSLAPFFGDTAWNNSISYASGDEDGFVYRVIANLSESAVGARGKNLGASVMYARGPLAASVVWQRVRNGTGLSTGLPPDVAPPGFRGQQTWQVGLAYDLEVAKLFGLYNHVDTHATDKTITKLWSVGASVPLGPGELLAQYGSAIASVGAFEPRHRTFSLGYDYSLSRSTDVYAVWMNDKINGLSAGNSLAGGIRLRF